MIGAEESSSAPRSGGPLRGCPSRSTSTNGNRRPPASTTGLPGAGRADPGLSGGVRETKSLDDDVCRAAQHLETVRACDLHRADPLGAHRDGPPFGPGDCDPDRRIRAVDSGRDHQDVAGSGRGQSMGKRSDRLHPMNLAAQVGPPAERDETADENPNREGMHTGQFPGGLPTPANPFPLSALTLQRRREAQRLKEMPSPPRSA